jgi:hypothetical protein
VPAAFTGPELGAGALHQDGTVAGVVVNPGFRTQCTGHLGELVIHVLTTSAMNYPLLAQPGIPVTFTSHLILNPADPGFFILTPAMDTLVGFYPATPLTEYVQDKDLADTPLPIGLTGPFPAPGITYYVQAFIVNGSVSPAAATSTNVVEGNLY